MNTIRLAEVATIKMGQSPPGETYNRNGNGMPFFQGKADFGDVYPTVRYWCSAPKTKAEPNDILMSVRAPVGSINLNRIKSSYGRGLAAIRPTDSIDLKYLYHFLSHHEPKLAELGRGSTFEAVNRDDVEDIEIPFPSHPEQKRIAGILDKADRMRRQRRFAQTLSDSFLQSVFIKMFGDPVANQMNLAKIPFSQVARLVSGYAFESRDFVKVGIPLIRIGNANKGDMSLESLVYLPTSFRERLERFIIKPRDLIITLTGTVGKDDYGNVCYVSSDYPEWFLNQRVAKIELDETKVLKEFVLFVFKQEQFKTRLLSNDRGVRQANLSNADVLDSEMLCPPLPLQEKFAAIVQKFERIRRQQREATRQADHLFQTLLHRAFRGEL